jgi:hypothetical protein
MATEVIERRGSDAEQRVTKFIVHFEGEARVVSGNDDEEIGIIIERCGFGPGIADVNIFIGEFAGALIEAIEIEDGDDDHQPVGRHEKPKHHGHGGGLVHVHCHKCHRVNLGVGYNGVDKHHKFSPAATVETVRQWAVKKFKIAAVDAEKLFLWLSGAEQPLDGTKHVGDLGKAPGCHAELVLIPDPRVNG